MSQIAARIAVVANPGDGDQIVTSLAKAGFTDIHRGDGGDETLTLVCEIQPDIVIACADLDRGDVLALISAIRAEPIGKRVRIVLIGGTDGPVRNALDAADADIDQFLAQPLSSRALMFSIQRCLESKGQPPASAASTSDVALRPRADGMMGAVEDEGSMEFDLVDAVPAASQIEVAEAAPVAQPATVASVAPARAPSWREPTLILDPARGDGFGSDAGGDTGDEGGSDAGGMVGSDFGIVPHFDSDFVGDINPHVSLHDDDDDVTPLPEPVPLLYSDGDDGDGGDGEVGRIDAEFQLQIDDDLGEELMADLADASDLDSELTDLADLADLSAGAGDGARKTPAAVGFDEGDSGAFARELRRKMSAMAERWFPKDSHTGAGNPADHVAGLYGAQHEQSEPGDIGEVPLPPAQGTVSVPPGTSLVPPAKSERAEEPRARSRTARIATVSAAAPSPRSSSGASPGTPSGTSSIGLPPPRPVVDNPAAAYVGAHTGVPAQGRDAEGELIDSGELVYGKSDVATLVARMYRERFTGKIECTRPAPPSADIRKRLVFDGGRLVFASSNLEEDRLGPMLVREGKIAAVPTDVQLMAGSGRSRRNTAAPLRAATHRGPTPHHTDGEREDTRLGERLVELGYLKRRELTPAVRDHLEDVVYSLFSWDSGAYAISRGRFAIGERIRISRHPVAIVLEGIRRKYNGRVLMSLVGPTSTVMRITDETEFKAVMSVADLSPAERKVLARFNGRRSLAEIGEKSNLGRLAVYQLAYSLMALAAATPLRPATFSRHPQGDSAGIARASATAARGAGGNGEVGNIDSDTGRDPDLNIDRQRIAAKMAQVAEADYFTLLGVRRDASAFEIRRAYESARRNYAPEVFAAPLRREFAAALYEIATVLDEAYRILSDDGIRHSYIHNLYTPSA